MRLLRGLQLNKAILLEGSPGVGKTSLVTALAKATRNKVLRINLSDQTVSGNNLPEFLLDCEIFFKFRMFRICLDPICRSKAGWEANSLGATVHFCKR